MSAPNLNEQLAQWRWDSKWIAETTRWASEEPTERLRKTLVLLRENKSQGLRITGELVQLMRLR